MHQRRWRMDKLLAKMDGSVPWLGFRGSLGSSSNRFYVDFFSNNKLDRWGPTHGLKTKNSDERWGLQPIGDRDRDSYFLLVAETHVVGDGTNTHTSGEAKGHHASSSERIMFAFLIFASLLVLLSGERDTTTQRGNVFVSRQERKKRCDLLLCFL
jgi:hypothetical protein